MGVMLKACQGRDALDGRKEASAAAIFYVHFQVESRGKLYHSEMMSRGEGTVIPRGSDATMNR